MIRLKSLLKEDDIVKNKKTGNVYVVKQFDPAKHDKPTPAEVDKAKAANGGQLPQGEQPSKPTPQQPQQQTMWLLDIKQCITTLLAVLILVLVWLLCNLILLVAVILLLVSKHY